ncbi:MAG: O-antigen ligase family protein [Caldilineaceae bacterium]
MATYSLKVDPRPAARREWLARLLWLEPLWVGGVALPVLLPARLPGLAPYPWLVASLFLFWPLRLLAKRPLLAGASVDVYLAFFLLWLPVPLAFSTDRAQSWQAVGLNLTGVTLAVALIHWPPCRKWPLIPTLALVGAAGALALASPYLLQSTPEKLFDAPAWSSDRINQAGILRETINPNVLAGALILPIPLLAALTLQPRRTRLDPQRLLWGIIALGLGAAAILTQSRGAYIGLAAGLWLVFLLQWPRWRWGWVGALAALLGLLIWWGPAQILDQSAYVGAIDSYAGRREIWSRGWAALQDFPLTGLGPGLFGTLMPRLYPYFSFGPAAQIPHAHNLFLQVALDLGLPGLVGYGGIIVMTYVLLAGAMKKPTAENTRTLAIGALGAQTTVLVHGLTDAALWSAKLAWMPWLLLALAVLLNAPLPDFPLKGRESKAPLPMLGEAGRGSRTLRKGD